MKKALLWPPIARLEGCVECAEVLLEWWVVGDEKKIKNGKGLGCRKYDKPKQDATKRTQALGKDTLAIHDTDTATHRKLQHPRPTISEKIAVENEGVKAIGKKGDR